MSLSAGILTIGNEIVDGQITNRNSSWLASELIRLGFEVNTHLSVKDTHNEIVTAMNFLESRCQVILTTGGLGPTADDLTRKAIAHWAMTSLEFSQEHWNTIEEKLKVRKLTVRDGHKNQAEFPKGSTPILNPRGVAPGFFLTKGQNLVATLPGPPNELQAMWNETLKNHLQQEFQPQKEKKLYTWICMGAPESEVAHLVEEVLSDKKIDYGFRIHRPYVEVKLWANSTLSESLKALFQEITIKLEPWHVGTSIKNLRHRFYSRMKNYSQIYVVDHLSQGLFLERLKEYKVPKNLRYQTYFENPDDLKFFKKETCLEIIKHLNIGEHSLCLGLFPQSPESSLLILNDSVIEVPLPRGIPSTSRLGQLFAIETLFTTGYKELRE